MRGSRHEKSLQIGHWQNSGYEYLSLLTQRFAQAPFTTFDPKERAGFMLDPGGEMCLIFPFTSQSHY